MKRFFFLLIPLVLFWVNSLSADLDFKIKSIKQTKDGFLVEGIVTGSDLNSGGIPEKDKVDIVVEIPISSNFKYPEFYEWYSIRDTKYGKGKKLLTDEEVKGINIKSFSIFATYLRPPTVWSRYGGLGKWEKSAPDKVTTNFSGIIPLKYAGKKVRIHAILMHVVGGPYAAWPGMTYKHQSIEITLPQVNKNDSIVSVSTDGNASAGVTASSTVDSKPVGYLKKLHKGTFEAILKDLDGHDYGGRYEEIKPDGIYDYPLYLITNFPEKRIKDISIVNTNGRYTVWDTIPGNFMWALVVTKGGHLLQHKNSALIKPISANDTYILYLPDNGSVFEGKTHYKMTLYFTDGTKATANVINKIKKIDKRISAELIGLSNKDYGGKYEPIKPDGEKDYLMIVRLKCKFKRVVGISVNNINGRFSIWDTYPHNGMWSLAVVKDGSLMSKEDSSINFLLKKDEEVLYLYLPDNGSIKDGKTDYKITVVFKDNASVSCNVKTRF